MAGGHVGQGLIPKNLYCVYTRQRHTRKTKIVPDDRATGNMGNKRNLLFACVSASRDTQ